MSNYHIVKVDFKMNNLESPICCFTGHREIPDKGYFGIQDRLAEIITELIETGVNNFLYTKPI